ncbi:muscleblind-like protein 2a isoform X3 [Panonychus citri]|uniref:muscleblind-like protein 2a isoform X3 n=1 Tax=Panonychus citri TaxID=50023 RepID=UPI0023071E61|nr:muscleblind-like protein 2a isoform X3 [Panonychus citri]
MINGLNNVKDSRWLQLEVCREFQRNKCTRPGTECKFAHPPAGVDVQNGRVVACYDSIKGRCNRDKPPCRYFHPPQHLKDQLLINGRNHLASKNVILQQMPQQTVLNTGQLPLPNSTATAAATSHVLAQAAVASTLAAVEKRAREAGDLLMFNYQQHFIPLEMVNGLNNVKDSRWLQLEVCREFQRNKCTRPGTECKFAHPPAGVDVQNGRVVACYDSIKGRCNRDKPPCRYFHPPQHLKDQLLINGRNHLASKNVILQQMPQQTVLNTGQLPLVSFPLSLVTKPNSTATAAAATSHVLAQAAVASTLAAGKKRARETGDLLMTFPGVLPMTKRPALEKSGLPVFQPAAMVSAYQQALAMYQSFVPLAYKWSS